MGPDGRGPGIRHFGGRALNALRLEKSFGGWTREFTPDCTPFEAGLSRFVSLGKNDFIGRDAALEAKETGSERHMVTLVVEADGSFEVEILGERRPATLAPGPLYDPEGTRMRS